MRFSELENCRVAILGAGREGQAVWRQIRRRFPSKPISLFAEAEIDIEFLQVLDPLLDDYHVAPLDFDILKNFEVLVRSAGISPYRQELQRLRSAGKRFTSASSLWFAENPDTKTICISGTMGKSTTAKLLAHLLGHAGVKVCLAGNIGQHMLDSEETDIDWWVIELSSYQLSDLEAKPDVALLLNLSEEHVDWHGGVERYRVDKLRLAELARGGLVIANFADATLAERLAGHPGLGWFNHEQTWQAGENAVIGSQAGRVSAPVALPGAHNMHNLAAALTVVDKLGFKIKDIDSALSSFRGLPHRQQFIGEKSGIRYINDSISTTPVSVSAALHTIGTADVVLLLGGLDRGLDWNEFATQLAEQTPHAIITMPDNGPKIFACLKTAGVKPPGGLHTVAQLSDAVELAEEIVPPDGCILLSPGAPSFPHFKDYADRGRKFEEYAAIEKI
jgi:UDP-N-acetylmuramoylalanine--D-glutamate ligase